MFAHNIIPTKCAEPSKINKKWLWKKLSFSLNGKNKKKIYFFSAYTKNISSHVLKILAISLVLRTREILIFSTHSMKYIWYSPQKSKYPLCRKEYSLDTFPSFYFHFSSLYLKLLISPSKIFWDQKILLGDSNSLGWTSTLRYRELTVFRNQRCIGTCQ